MFRTTFNDQRCKVIWKRSITHGKKKCYGLWVPDLREIWIEVGQVGITLADTLIHEGLHAEAPPIHEDTITHLARHIGLALFAKGKFPGRRKVNGEIASTLLVPCFGLDETFAARAAKNITAALFHPEVRGLL